MADVPGSTSRSSANHVVADTGSEEAVPTWLAARRSRVATGAGAPSQPELEVEFESISDAENAVAEEDSFVAGETEIALPVFVATNNPPVVAPPKPKVPPSLKVLPLRVDEKTTEQDNSFRGICLRFFRSALMAGILVSLAVHAVAIAILAMLIIGGAAIHPSLDVFGVMGEPNDTALTGVELDSGMPLGDPAPEGTAMEFPDAAQLLPSEQATFDPTSNLRGVAGGSGNGNGGSENGDGNGTIVAPVGVPKYAVTKGSYSVWTDPKDPEPGISYQIVIQFKLPRNVETYRGSDLSGMVIGTDGYKQAIRFGRAESFPVHDGSVQVRIRVPGADRLVRDTIRIESKLLREKQVIEIEF